MKPYQQISGIFEAISSSARLQILLAIGSGEACVCHLEALLGLRQAYISQQLMVLREKDIIGSRRDGKYIFYSLKKPEILDLILQASRLAGLPEASIDVSGGTQCACPKCEPINAVVPGNGVPAEPSA